MIRTTRTPRILSLERDVQNLKITPTYPSSRPDLRTPPARISKTTYGLAAALLLVPGAIPLAAGYIAARKIRSKLKLRQGYED